MINMHSNGDVLLTTARSGRSTLSLSPSAKNGSSEFHGPSNPTSTPSSSTSSRSPPRYKSGLLPRGKELLLSTSARKRSTSRSSPSRYDSSLLHRRGELLLSTSGRSRSSTRQETEEMEREEPGGSNPTEYGQAEPELVLRTARGQGRTVDGDPLMTPRYSESGSLPRGGEGGGGGGELLLPTSGRRSTSRSPPRHKSGSLPRGGGGGGGGGELLLSTSGRKKPELLLCTARSRGNAVANPLIRTGEGGSEEKKLDELLLSTSRSSHAHIKSPPNQTQETEVSSNSNSNATKYGEGVVEPELLLLLTAARHSSGCHAPEEREESWEKRESESLPTSVRTHEESRKAEPSDALELSRASPQEKKESVSPRQYLSVGLKNPTVLLSTSRKQSSPTPVSRATTLSFSGNSTQEEHRSSSSIDEASSLSVEHGHGGNEPHWFVEDDDNDFSSKCGGREDEKKWIRMVRSMSPCELPKSRWQEEQDTVDNLGGKGNVELSRHGGATSSRLSEKRSGPTLSGGRLRSRA